MNLPLICIDELVDSGMDTIGVESALGILKKMERDPNKNILLITEMNLLVVNNVYKLPKRMALQHLIQK